VGPLIDFIEEEGPALEGEIEEAAEVISSEAEALEKDAEVVAEEAETEAKEIFQKLEQKLSPDKVGQTQAECSAAIQQDIQAALNSSNAGEQLEGEVASGLQKAGVEITNFQKAVGPNGSIGEIDVETPQAIIETTVSASGKLSQISKLIGNPEMNPLSKPVILYAPNYGNTAAGDITEAGAHVVRNLGDLTTLLGQLGGK
jgi:hypothetical protein